MLQKTQGLVFKKELEHLIQLRNQAHSNFNKRTYSDKAILEHYDSF
jgi:hypothetical protein